MVVAQQEIEQAKTLAREGNSQAAITVLSKLIQVEAGNAEAWLALAQVVEEPDRIEFCLQKVLKLDAGNPT
ncbi:MAG: tetratricopeptide repeat protein, partial [Chloroflexi bacterium]|nr:tetratricopeptide repeat protein [Chloroflexota bacterium]